MVPVSPSGFSSGTGHEAVVELDSALVQQELKRAQATAVSYGPAAGIQPCPQGLKRRVRIRRRCDEAEVTDPPVVATERKGVRTGENADAEPGRTLEQRRPPADLHAAAVVTGEEGLGRG